MMEPIHTDFSYTKFSMPNAACNLGQTVGFCTALLRSSQSNWVDVIVLQPFDFLHSCNKAPVGFVRHVRCYARVENDLKSDLKACKHRQTDHACLAPSKREREEQHVTLSPLPPVAGSNDNPPDIGMARNSRHPQYSSREYFQANKDPSWSRSL